ncbi:MAG: DUF1854 domain-containing protein [Clostridia bacterium]|nr:DUF1854 domain-containing protein [Clostridia bacterium]MBQ7339101.1 DUF1854 domain-containing protein [Clostridia bacterium]
MANNETENKKIVAAKDTAAPAKTGELSEEDEALFRVRVSIPLTGENTIFTRSEGNLISMKVTQPDGTVEEFERVVPVRAFPITDPEEFISVKEPDSREKGKGAEIGLIRRMSDFDADTQALLREELDRRYFTPVIKKLTGVKEKFGYFYWDAETSAGKVSFVMTNVSSNIRTLEDGRVFIHDIDGNCFQIPDPAKLDKASLKKIEIYM